MRFTVEGETDAIMIEPFLFISFIENGFKHALDNSFTEPFIYITLRIVSGQITLNVINSSNTNLETQAKRINGKGMSNSKSSWNFYIPILMLWTLSRLKKMKPVAKLFYVCIMRQSGWKPCIPIRIHWM